MNKKHEKLLIALICLNWYCYYWFSQPINARFCVGLFAGYFVRIHDLTPHHIHLALLNKFMYQCREETVCPCQNTRIHKMLKCFIFRTELTDMHSSTAAYHTYIQAVAIVHTVGAGVSVRVSMSAVDLVGTRANTLNILLLGIRATPSSTKYIYVLIIYGRLVTEFNTAICALRRQPKK